MRRIADRGGQIIAGLILLVPGLFLLLISGIAVLSGILDRRDRSLLWWALPCAFVTAHVVFWGGRLLAGRPRRDGGLLSPRWFSAFGLLIFSFPLLSLATGAYRSGPFPVWLLILLAVLSPLCVYGLSVMVSQRRRRAQGRHTHRQHGGPNLQ